MTCVSIQIMHKRLIIGIIASAFLILSCLRANGQNIVFDRYHKPEEISATLKELARTNPKRAKIHQLAKSVSGRELVIIEIGNEVDKSKKSNPAVFVAANMEGTTPLASEAALHLAQILIQKADQSADRTWYILACGHPDAASSFFAKPLFRDSRNGKPVNDDMDDQVDEDGPEDLNGDGIIALMRVKDPEGEWLPVPAEPRLMKKADWAKGEKGIYKLYTEGIDNDGDGLYNEDGPGGVNIGINFPHLFQHFTRDGGVWPGSEKESYALMRFFDLHREIGLVFVFGEVNFCYSPPRSNRRSEADLNQIKIPERFASYIGADPNKAYTLAEVMEMVRPLAPPGMEITEAMVASFLGLGAVVNPLDDDLKFYREISEQYKEFLKKNKLDAKRLEPAQDKDGSFELWAYYHMGLPSFALDFWTLPEVQEAREAQALTPESLEKMSNEEFIALGDDKIDAFLKSVGAPAQFKAKQVIEALKGGMMDTKRMAEMLKKMPKPPTSEGADPKEKALLAFSDKELGGKGFLPWSKFNHPTLGEVEIGGPVPFADNTPPPKMLESLLKTQLPWVFEVASKMARIKINNIKTRALSSNAFELEVIVENAGGLPYPIAMAQRNQRLLPVIISLEGEGVEFIDGRKRAFVQALKPLETKSVKWILKIDKKTKINLRLETQAAGQEEKIVELGGGK